MGGIKTKGRGPDKKKRKSRKKVTPAPGTESEKKSGVINTAIKTISENLGREKKEEERWAFDFGEQDSPDRPLPVLMGRHVFKDEDVVEIDLGEL